MSVITNIVRDQQLDHGILCAVFSQRCWSSYALNLLGSLSIFIWLI